MARIATVLMAHAGDGEASSSAAELAVRDTRKGGGGALVVHAGVVRNGELRVGQPVRSCIACTCPPSLP